MLAAETYDDLDPREFADPSAPYRMMPWWFWNGEMEPELMRWQIAQMHEAGCGGFFITPRQGLGVPYLSADYFERFILALREAEARGMLVGIMDDYPYPSGMAGGATTWANPGFIRANLQAFSFEIEGPQTLRRALGPGQVLRAWAWPVRGGAPDWRRTVDLRPRIGVSHARTGLSWGKSLTEYSYARFGSWAPQSELAWQVPDGRWRVMIFAVDRCRSFKYYGEFLDTCNREAVAHFLALTFGGHEQGLGRAMLGERFRMVFTDETTGGNWTWRLPEHFAERCGYDLLPHLPALLDDGFPHAARVRYDYLATLHELFMDAYHGQYAAECERRGLLYTTEVAMLRNADQAVAHIPGIDHAHERIGEGLPHGWQSRGIDDLRHWPRFQASIAAQQGRPRVAVEAFHSLGWGVRLADLKTLIDRMAALGVNLFSSHGFYYAAGGPAKFDAAPSEFYQHPWWRHARALGDYAARLSYLASRGRDTADVAVLDPVTSCWTAGADHWHVLAGLGADTARGKRLRDDWACVSEALHTHQRDFHSLDPLDLGAASVEGAELVVGECRYRALVIPPIANLEAAAAARLREFAQAGGIVLALGLLPIEEIEPGTSTIADVADVFGADPRAAAGEYFDGRGDARWTGEGGTRLLRAPGGVRASGGDALLLAALDELAPPWAEVEAPEAWRDHILLLRREVAGTGIALLASAAPEEVDVTVRLRTPAAGLERWDAESGERTPVPVRRASDRLACTVTLPAHGTVALVTTEGAAAPSPEACVRAVALDLTQPWRLAETPRNVLRLGAFRVALGTEDVAPEVDDASWPEVPPEPFVNVLARLTGRRALPVRISPGSMAPTGWRVEYPQTVSYRARFVAEQTPADLRLVADRHGLAGRARVFVNGHELRLEDADPDFIFDRSQISWPIADCVAPGENALAVVIVVAADDQGLLDALWLTGSFGVAGAPGEVRRLVVPPAAVLPLDLAASGLPHFAGTLALTTDLELPADATHLELAPGGGAFLDCAEVFVGGDSLGVRCWPPYGWALPEGARGGRSVRLEITTPAGPAIEGRAFDVAAGEYREL